MWKEGGVVVNDDQLASSTPLISSLSTAFSLPSPQLNLPVIPSASFDVRTVTSLGPLSKLLLTVDMMAGNLHALKSTKDAITKKNIFSHDKIEQLVKSTTCNTRLDMFVNGMKKKTYVFDDARQRETFCQLIQQLKRKHSSDVDVNYVSIFIGSWNMGSEIPMFCLQPWLRSDGLGKKRSKTLGMIGHDIYVVGTQESSLSDKEWSNRILSLLMESFGEEYYVVLIASLWSIRTLIIAKSKHKKKISNVQQSTVKTGIANALGNKGAMGVSLHFGGTSFCFINAHLTSGGEKMKRRNDNVKDISRFLDMGMKYGKDVTNKFHHVFFFGDLNYRLDQLDPQTIAESVKNADGNYQQLLEHDQLKQCINNKELCYFKYYGGVEEEEILFPPTYRYMKGSSDCYVWEKKKATGVRINVPSWCDRVLWKSYPYFWITNTSYGCCNNVCSSDHKPVFSSFDVKVRSPLLAF
ncbi:hypothetical protein HELRODRAFT_192166 [Helobdella robusta]|uniref:phosphatidylinositol-3,4,5-trisphosphate 5-phosphatase n=1 Tax=Helobdella robusta TaxID=6412 RepID=T1FTN2_HELRO|nr:hypothetical protein HELRODRAFT_192166 [Helobdella robusta]ESO02937.1 hypothetical protein HELRODRAFT_192166 [Helobdella robusta]